MARSRWSDLDPRRRRLILIGATVEGGLKIAALIDLARAPGPGRPRFEATVGGGYHGDQLGWRRADRLLGLRTSSGLVVATEVPR